MPTSPLKFAGLFPSTFDRKWVREDLHSAMADLGTYEVMGWSGRAPVSDEKMMERLAGVDVVLTGWPSPPLPLALLQQKPRCLKYICNLTGSVRRWIPRDYLEAGIRITNWGQGPMWYLAEGNLALILGLTFEMQRMHRHMVERPSWVYPYASPSPTLRGKTVGFVGFGAVSVNLWNLLAPFSCKGVVYDPFATEIPGDITRCNTLEELFSGVDIITIQCGLNPKTEGMIGKELLDLMKPHALFINTARGKIIREKELIEFLGRRKDISAGLDVFETEPLPPDSPLLHMDNVICYPHSVAGGEANLQVAASAQAARNILAYGQGEILEAEITQKNTTSSPNRLLKKSACCKND